MTTLRQTTATPAGIPRSRSRWTRRQRLAFWTRIRDLRIVRPAVLVEDFPGICAGDAVRWRNAVCTYEPGPR